MPKQLRDYDHAIALDPDFALAYVNRGNTRVYLEDYEGAVDDYQRAGALNIDSVLVPDALRAFYAAKESVVLEVARQRWQHIESRNADLVDENSRIAADIHALRSTNEQLTKALAGRGQPTVEVSQGPDSSQIQYYVDAQGITPYIDWLIELDRGLQRRVRDAVSQMQRGNFGDSKPLRRDGLFERRLDSGLRIYYAKSSKPSVIILGGGAKPNQQQDIDTAANRWTDWVGRQGK